MMSNDEVMNDPVRGATIALAAGDVDAARTAYRRALDEGTVDVVTGHLGLAICHARRRQWARAATALRDALEHDPECGRAHALFGAVRFEQGDVEPALSELDLAALLAPDDAVVRLKRAEILLRLGRLNEAERECRRAVTLAGADAETRDYARALALGIRRELAGALHRDTPSPALAFSRLSRAVRSLVGRRSRAVPADATFEGSL